MKVIYIADDGKEFEDKDMCLEYENLHNAKIKKLLSEIHAFTEEGKEIKVSGLLDEYDIETMSREAVYVTFDSDEARHFFDDKQEHYGYVPIHECTTCRDGDVFIYSDCADEWISAKEMIEHYQAILDKFRNERSENNGK